MHIQAQPLDNLPHKYYIHIQTWKFLYHSRLVKLQTMHICLLRSLKSSILAQEFPNSLNVPKTYWDNTTLSCTGHSNLTLMAVMYIFTDLLLLLPNIMPVHFINYVNSHFIFSKEWGKVIMAKVGRPFLNLKGLKVHSEEYIYFQLYIQE